MITSGMMSSETAEHFTPPSLLDAVRAVAPIGLDPCWSPKSFTRPRVAVCLAHPQGAIKVGQEEVFYTDGLTYPWDRETGLVFVNSPYGRGIGPWQHRCAHFGRVVPVMSLVPARTDAGWFQGAAAAADAICLLRGRVRFWTDRWCATCGAWRACTRDNHVVEVRDHAGESDPAPFPSALLFWGPAQHAVLTQRFQDVFQDKGIVFT